MLTSWTRTLAGAAALGAVVILAGCGSGGTATSTATSAPATGSGSASASAPAGPAATEINPAGDIPDNQAFVPYQGAGFTVTTPEGWAQSTVRGSIVFSDKYNSITVVSSAAARAPTIASATRQDVPAIKAAATGFVAGSVTGVHRTAGTAVLITYRARSQVNAVTGKVVLQAVERYTFWRAGRSVTLTLAAPVGSDNVDPWRIVTDSFTWAP